MSAGVTASKLELLERCPAAAALPAVWTESTDDQIAGTARHRYLERAPAIGRDAALAEVDEAWRAQCEAIDVTEVPAGTAELAYAYDVATDTARLLGQWIGRAYEVGPTEVSGTVDLVCEPTPDRPRWLVVDWKGDEEVERAAVNVQLGHYALCVARVHDLEEVDVAIGNIGHGGAIRWDRATLGPFELGAIAARVGAAWAAVQAARELVAAGRTPDVATGLHCRRCPAMPVCPAMVTLVRELDTTAQAAAPEIVSSLVCLPDEAAGRAWVRVQLFEELVANMKASLRARAETRPLPLPDGSRLVAVEVPRRSVVLDKALPLLRERFGAEQADAAVERSLSAEAIGKLARQLAPGKGQKKAVDELWAALEAAGGVRRSQYIQLRVKRAKGDVAAEGGEP